MSEITDSRGNGPVFRGLQAMSKARLVEYALDRRRELAALEAKLKAMERQNEELIIEVAMLAKCLRANGISMKRYSEFAAQKEKEDE